jgi:AcrR family transcriptional regulator
VSRVRETASGSRRRPAGERSRRVILETAARLATVEGLDGLSIGRLADATGMSKSGLYAHFGSKEELQLATVETASGIFEVEVVRRGLGGGEGLSRLHALCEAYLDHVERKVFPGGCFFASAAAELDSRPGPVKDRIAAVNREWLELLERLCEEAQARGELDDRLEPAQVAFELNAVLLAANARFLLQGDAVAFDRARRAIRERLGDPPAV